MRRRSVVGFVVLFFAFVGVVFACGGRPPVEPPPADLGVVAGRVFKGAVKGATVTVYRLNGLERGVIAGTATSDDEGAFRVGVGTATGPFLVAAKGGSFVDEATGVAVQLNSAELTALVPAFAVETKLENLRITPLSHLATGLALYWARTESKELSVADAEAWQHLNRHFGALDWRVQTPVDVTAAVGAPFDEPAKEGLLLAALSMQARLIAETAGVTPGGRVNALGLTQALYDDVTADGFFDGLAAGGAAILLPAGAAVADAGVTATVLDGQTARTGLAQAVAKFLASDRNVATISLADAQSLIAAISTNDDSRIFRGTSGPADVENPTIAFVKPATDHAGVHGAVELEVRALDDVGLKSFVFTAPASLVATPADFAADRKSAVLKTTLDVSALQDGALELAVHAVDTSTNEATKSLTIVVSNRGPTITVNAPSESATVSGVVAISATATAQAGAISKLELRQPPMGLGADTLPAAAEFGATWDTLQVAEGLVTLSFHAEDTLGGVADRTVAVSVDNVPLGTVTTTASLGTPVGGLSVKLVAIDEATGQPVLGRPGGAVLGQTPLGTTTSAETGAVTFTLTQENYEGPVQVVAQGTAATYLDPSSPDAGAAVSLPTSFTLTSYVAQYKTGDALAVPLTGWTTLADDATLAYARGKNPSAPQPRALSSARAVVEPLFPAHISKPTTWPLRTTAPVSLLNSSQSLRDVVYAAMPDVALNQLARDIALDVGLTPATGYALPQLLTALRQDVSDGQLDGRVGTLQLATGGTTPYALDANTSRFKLAIALDRFIRGPNNKTGLTRQDLQTQSVFGNISEDTCLLYPTSQPPILFDNQPPAVTFEVSFRQPGGTPTSPVGTNHLVGGVVTVTATATDPSGVQSLLVSASSGALTPDTANTPQHYTATFAATQEGPITFTATVADLLSNSGTSTYAVVYDATPPTFDVANPSASSFYSATVPLDVTAHDSNGVATLTQSGLTNLTDTDIAPERFAATWATPVAQPDGLVHPTFTACDLVQNCATLPVTATIDRTPPSLTWVQPPPAWTQTSTATLAVAATDIGAGVAHVYAQAGSGNIVELTRNADSYSGTITWLPTAASVVVALWADDFAIAPNSGQTGPEPHRLTATIRKDITKPIITNVPATTYFDERDMGITADANDRPVLPVVYTFPPAATRQVTQTPATLWKATSRLDWGPVPLTSADLNGQNIHNVPVLRFGAAYDALVDSPIDDASAVFTVTSTAGSASGSLIPSVATATGKVLFDLPIGTGTLPFLTNYNATAPIVLSFAITISDTAGNATTLSNQAVTLNLLPPPLHVAHRGYCSGSSDCATYNLSTYVATVGGTTTLPFSESIAPTQPPLTNPGAFVSAQDWTIWNPYPFPVAFRLTTGATPSWTTVEEWTHSTIDDLPIVSGFGSVVPWVSLGQTNTFLLNGISYEGAAQPVSLQLFAQCPGFCVIGGCTAPPSPIPVAYSTAASKWGPPVTSSLPATPTCINADFSYRTPPPLYSGTAPSLHSAPERYSLASPSLDFRVLSSVTPPTPALPRADGFFELPAATPTAATSLVVRWGRTPSQTRTGAPPLGQDYAPSTWVVGCTGDCSSHRYLGDNSHTFAMYWFNKPTWNPSNLYLPRAWVRTLTAVVDTVAAPNATLDRYAVSLEGQPATPAVVSSTPLSVVLRR
jgi:hypothetical protein